MGGFLPGIPSPSWAFNKDIGGAVWVWPAFALLNLGAYVYWRIRYARVIWTNADLPKHDISLVLVHVILVVACIALAWWYLISLALKR
jgi:DNA-binding transcriptional regulator of glucitol operon